jgi:hypothetical protein
MRRLRPAGRDPEADLPDVIDVLLFRSVSHDRCEALGIRRYWRVRAR